MMMSRAKCVSPSSEWIDESCGQYFLRESNISSEELLGSKLQDFLISPQFPARRYSRDCKIHKIHKIDKTQNTSPEADCTIYLNNYR